MSHLSATLARVHVVTHSLRRSCRCFTVRGFARHSTSTRTDIHHSILLLSSSLLLLLDHDTSTVIVARKELRHERRRPVRHRGRGALHSALFEQRRQLDDTNETQNTTRVGERPRLRPPQPRSLVPRRWSSHIHTHTHTHTHTHACAPSVVCVARQDTSTGRHTRKETSSGFQATAQTKSRSRTKHTATT